MVLLVGMVKVGWAMARNFFFLRPQFWDLLSYRGQLGFPKREGRVGTRCYPGCLGTQTLPNWC